MFQIRFLTCDLLVIQDILMFDAGTLVLILALAPRKWVSGVCLGKDLADSHFTPICLHATVHLHDYFLCLHELFLRTLLLHCAVTRMCLSLTVGGDILATSKPAERTE